MSRVASARDREGDLRAWLWTLMGLHAWIQDQPVSERAVSTGLAPTQKDVYGSV